MSSDATVQLLQRSGESFVETKHEVRKTPKFSYTREFLLSLSELDVCKELPAGFDSSLLSEFEDVSGSAFERQRNLGGPLQGSRRNEYGSPSLKRVDGAGSYSRGSHGRWDTNSTGSSDKDGESQSDRESFSQDSGSHYVNQSRRPWQNPEHDGLLGSGAFLRPSGLQGGASAPKGRGNGHHQLSRSTERYQPPRPYKATPYSWRDNTDSYNDETFGSSECSSQERAEEERKRRASFELMRKEQQKALQENQKPTSDKHKENLDDDMIALLENSKIDKNLKNNGDDKLEDNSASLVSESDSAKGSFPAYTASSRPPVPPGFASTITEKNLGAQPSKTLGPGVGIVGKSPILTKGALTVNGGESDLEKGHNSGVDVHSDRTTSKSNSIAVSFADAIEHPLAGLAAEDSSVAARGLLGADRSWEGVISSLNEEKFTLSVNTDRNEQDQSTSILDKLFDSTSTKDEGSVARSIEHQGANINEKSWSPTSSQSSKYAHWFSEGDKKPAEDLSSRDLLSLIISKNKTGSEKSSISHEPVHPSFPFENGETRQESFTSAATSSVTRVHDLYDLQGKPDTNSGVLTCEDLEQSILADAKESSSSLLDIVQGPWNTTDANSELQKANVDDHASQHLLSLLHKGMCSKDLTNPELTQSSERLGNVNVKSEVPVTFAGNNCAETAEAANRTEKSLTLEALFGSAFMKELHSMETPVSGHRGSVDDHIDTSVPQLSQMSLPHANYMSSSGEYGSNITPEGNISIKHTQQATSQKYQEPWMGFEDFRPKISVPANFVAHEEGSLGIHLPEEESLITVGDTVSPIMADPFPVEASKNVELLGSRRPDDIFMDKLAALSIPRNNDRYSAPELDAPSAHGLYHIVEPGLSYQYVRRPSSPQFPHPHVDHVRSLFQPSDNPPHRNPLMNFIGAENIHHDAHLPQHQFPSNNIHHHPFHNPGGPMFDPAIPLPMAVPGNFPPRQPHQGFPRGAPLAHPLNHMPAYMPEMNAMHGFPRQPSYSGFGMGIPGTGPTGPGGGDPEQLKRLMEMRTNFKQTHISAPGHIPGMYSYELDMGFR